MQVEVTLSLGIEKYTENGKRVMSIELTTSSTIGDVLRIIKLPPEEPWLITLNGRQAFLETELSSGDRVKIFPLLAGG